MSRNPRRVGKTIRLAALALVIVLSTAPLVTHAQILENSPAMRFARATGETLESLKEDTDTAWASLPAASSLAGEFVHDVWCGMIGLVGFSCEKKPPVAPAVPAVPAPGTTIVTTTVTPLPEEADEWTASTTPQGRVVYTTVIEEHNTYVTNPTTVIRQSSGGGGGSSDGVSMELFRKQVERIYESIGGRADELADDIAEAFTTAVLTVTGNADIDGNLNVGGTITAGSLAVTSVSSGGAVEAPYFTATSSTASTFPYASTTAISVSGTASTTNLSAQTATVGDITIITLSVTSTLDTPGLTATRSTTTSATTTNLYTDNFRLANVSGFLKATAGVVGTALINLATDITGILPVGNGGTGWAAIQSGAIPYGNGAGALATTTQGTGGQILAWLNGIPSWTATSTFMMESEADSESELEALLADVANVFTNNDGTLADDDLTNNSIEDLSDVAAMTENLGDLLYWNGSGWADIATSSLNVALANTTGTLPVDRGGTGATTLTGLLQGNGTGAFTTISNSSTAGQVLRVTGASTYAWGALDLDDGDAVTGTLGSANIEDLYVFNTGDSISGNLTFSGTAANIALGSNWLSGDGDDEGIFVGSSGNVGIGTTSPVAKLEIYTGNASAGSILLGGWVGNAAYNVINLTGKTATNDYTFLSSYADPDLYINRPSGGDVYFREGNSASSHLAILTGGNVGVGHTNPTSKLSIIGTASEPTLTAGSAALLDLYASGGTNLVITTSSNSPFTTSFQNRNVNTDGFSYPIALNPLGGNVGIGTTSPVVKLHVSSGANPAAAIFKGSNGGAVGIGTYPTVNYGYITGYTNENAAAVSALLLNPDGGNVGILNSNPSVALDVTGDIEYTGTITDVSDERLKENIEDIEDPFTVLGGLNAKSFNMIGEERRDVGFLAQDVKLVMPDSVQVVDPEEGYLGVSYLDFIPYLVEAVNELWTSIQSLGQQMAAVLESIGAQETRINTLEERIRELEAREGIDEPEPEGPPSDSPPEESAPPSDEPSDETAEEETIPLEPDTPVEDSASEESEEVTSEPEPSPEPDPEPQLPPEPEAPSEAPSGSSPAE